MFKHKGRVLALVLALAAVLRCLFIATRNIQYDDMFSFFLSRADLSAIVSGTAADTMPPLFYFLLHFWLQISQAIWFLRLLSVLISLGIVYVLYLTVKLWNGENAGLWAAFLAAINPLQMYHAQDIRMYALLALCQLLYVYFFSKLVHDQKGAGSWIGMILAGVGAMYTHNLGAFILPVPFLYLLLKKNWKLFGQMILAHLAILACLAPWLWMLPGQIAKIQGAFWTPRPGFVEVFQAIIMSSANLPLTGFWLYVGALVSLEIFVLMVFELIRNRKKNGDLLFQVIWWLLPPALLFVVSYVMRPVFVPRGFLISMVGFLALGGILIDRSWPKKSSPLILGGFVIAAVITLPGFYLFNHFPRSPYADAMAYLQQNLAEGERVVHDNKLSFFPMRYYSDTIQQNFVRDEAGSANDTYAPASQVAIGLIPSADLETAVGGADRFYFVYFSEVIDEAVMMELDGYPPLEWLKAHYESGETVVFEDLILQEFIVP